MCATATSKLLFLTTTKERPENTPAFQTLIRQHVMHDIGKSRRSSGNRSEPCGDLQQQPWPVMQVDKSSIGPIKASSRKGRKDLGIQEVVCSPQHDTLSNTSQNITVSFQHTKHVTDPLGSGSSDPFVCYPIGLDSQTRRLISFSERVTSGLLRTVV